MPTIAIDFDESQFSMLTEWARDRRLTVVELVREKVDESLKRHATFQATASDVLKKNEELYSRLAR